MVCFIIMKGTPLQEISSLLPGIGVRMHVSDRPSQPFMANKGPDRPPEFGFCKLKEAVRDPTVFKQQTKTLDNPGFRGLGVSGLGFRG